MYNIFENMLNNVFCQKLIKNDAGEAWNHAQKMRKKQNDAYVARNHRFWTFMRLVLFDATERVC